MVSGRNPGAAANAVGGERRCRTGCLLDKPRSRTLEFGPPHPSITRRSARAERIRQLERLEPLALLAPVGIRLFRVRGSRAAHKSKNLVECCGAPMNAAGSLRFAPQMLVPCPRSGRTRASICFRSDPTPPADRRWRRSRPSGTMQTKNHRGKLRSSPDCATNRTELPSRVGDIQGGGATLFRYSRAEITEFTEFTGYGGAGT